MEYLVTITTHVPVGPAMSETGRRPRVRVFVAARAMAGSAN
jgi:hypothetical protein